MPSGWTNSGIDWTSTTTMRASRTEDIVKHLHQAVSERDHWISKMGKYFRQGSPPAIETDARFRIEDSYDYIIKTLREWFMPESLYNYEPNIPNRDEHAVPFNRSVFFNPDKVGATWTGSILPLYYGYGCIDYTLGGDLEQLTGFDVSFIRDYNTSSFNRIDLINLKKIYDILKLKKFCRMSSLEYNVIGTGPWTPTSLDMYRSDNLNLMAISLKGEDTTINDAISDFYSQTLVGATTRARASGWESFSRNAMRISTGGQGFLCEQYFLLVNISEIGFNGQTFGISDFDYKCLSTPMLFPSPLFGEYQNSYLIHDKKGVYNYTNTFLLPDGDYTLITEDELNSGVPSQQFTQERYRCGFISLDEPGFLNYYTEPPPP